MEISRKHKVLYHEVTPSYRMKLSAALRQLQEASVSHSDMVGCGAEELAKEGLAWVLNTIVMDIARSPRYGEEVEARTWHRGAKSFYAFREYELYAGEERLVAASSLWLLLYRGEKTDKRKIIKIPGSITEKYGKENKRATELDLDAYKTDFRVPSVFSLEITVRSTDFDPIGHVNNAVYLDYLETLLAAFPEKLPAIRRLVLRYVSEISPDVTKIRMDLGKGEPGYHFQMSDGKKPFASGVFFG